MRRLQSFWGRYEVGGDGGDELERVARLVVDDRDLEGVEEVGELGWAVAGERRPEIGNRCQERLDLVRLVRVASARFELTSLLAECRVLTGEFLDSRLGCRDDGMFGVVVLFEAERLAADGLVEVGEPAGYGGELRRETVVALGERGGEFVVEEAEAVWAEEASAEEVEERFEYDLFADAEDARVAGCVGSCDSALVYELAAVPVGAFLVAAFHSPAAEAAVDAPAEGVHASVAVTGPLDVRLRCPEGRDAVVAERAFLDLVEELAADDRLV